MRLRLLLLAALVWLGGFSAALAQFKEGEPGGSKTGKSEVTRWQIGVTVKAAGGACRGGNGYISVPMDWPEQEVNVVKEEVSPEIKIHYAQMETGLKVMNIKLGQLAAGHEAKAMVTFEIRRSALLPPDDTDVYVLPDVKKLPREVRQYLSPSPKIESRDPRIRELAKTDRGRQGEGVGEGRGDLRLGPREGQVQGRPLEGRPGGAAGRHRRLRGDHLVVHRHLPGGRHSRPQRLGARPLLSRVLSGGRQGARALVSLPVGRRGSSAASTSCGRSGRRGTTSIRPSRRSGCVTWTSTCRSAATSGRKSEQPRRGGEVGGG